MFFFKQQRIETESPFLSDDFHIRVPKLNKNWKRKYRLLSYYYSILCNMISLSLPARHIFIYQQNHALVPIHVALRPGVRLQSNPPRQHQHD